MGTTAQPWFVGHWSGSYRAQAVEPALQAPEAAQEQWHTASATTPSNGVLSLRVAPNGEAQGDSAGDLGQAKLAGHAQADAIKLRFEAGESNGGYAGTLILRRENASLCVGTLRVSTGDSLAIRQASVNLKRHE
ncbi:MAG TPA: hypothetical protein VL137_11410 [Polyangiaceae bacterium]|nr:hypothetical protein [Polyangiaceae bacterium]